MTTGEKVVAWVVAIFVLGGIGSVCGWLSDPCEDEYGAGWHERLYFDGTQSCEAFTSKYGESSTLRRPHPKGLYQ